MGHQNVYKLKAIVTEYFDCWEEHSGIIYWFYSSWLTGLGLLT